MVSSSPQSKSEAAVIPYLSNSNFRVLSLSRWVQWVQGKLKSGIVVSGFSIVLRSGNRSAASDFSTQLPGCSSGISTGYSYLEISLL